MLEGLPVQRAAAIVALDAISRNCERIRSGLAEGGKLCAVVKADGYGHGMHESAGAALAGGADALAVATAVEAWELRERFADARILILGAIGDAELDVALGSRAELTVWHPGFLAELRARAASVAATPRVHVKYDTGLGRLGERDPRVVAELVEAVAAAPELELAGLWTHFATADEDDDAFMREQLERFCELALPLRERHEGLELHCANSAAALREPATHLDMVRCGIAVYGLDPFGRDAAAQGLEPAMSLYSYLAAVKPAARGESAGYGRRWRAAEPTVVGTIPFGYGDGYRRVLSNNADVLVGGRRRPVVGTVSMDNITVDLGAGAELEPGTPVILIGADGEERVSAEELAERAGTINYEITCGISPRVPRIHLRGRPRSAS